MGKACLSAPVFHPCRAWCWSRGRARAGPAHSATAPRCWAVSRLLPPLRAHLPLGAVARVRPQAGAEDGSGGRGSTRPAAAARPVRTPPMVQMLQLNHGRLRARWGRATAARGLLPQKLPQELPQVLQPRCHLSWPGCCPRPLPLSHHLRLHRHGGRPPTLECWAAADWAPAVSEDPPTGPASALRTCVSVRRAELPGWR